MATRLLPSERFADTRGGSRMRECRPYGFVRGARGEAHVPTAISNSVHAPCCTCSRQHLGQTGDPHRCGDRVSHTSWPARAAP